MIAGLACGAALGGVVGPATAAAPGTTELLRGPVAFRLTGYQHAPSTTSLGDYRYAIVFKLNRDPQGRLPDTDEYQNRGVSRGTFALDGYDAEVAHLYPVKHAPAGKAHCFVGYVDDGNASWLRQEARRRLGSKVRVTLRPLNKLADGTHAFGTRLVRRPHLQQADVALKSRDARRLLAKIGC
jgi:hypothetical protein